VGIPRGDPVVGKLRGVVFRQEGFSQKVLSHLTVD
jgi:hypothetical protein